MAKIGRTWNAIESDTFIFVFDGDDEQRNDSG